MLNRDINSRFEDWLISPAETLDFEVKKWLDLSDVECQGLIAKALIALENHGGGFLLVGFKEDEQGRLVVDDARPSDLSSYSTDALNAIIKRRAEPAFHVEVIPQIHPENGLEFPLIRVPGTTAVPVRSDSSTPDGTLKNYTYYIRAPGPESRSPMSATEWDSLLRRSIMKQRDEVIAVLRGFLGDGGAGEWLNKGANSFADLDEYIAEALGAWGALNEQLETGHPGRIKDGHFYFAARIIGTSKNLRGRELLDLLERGKRYTGWPIFLLLHRDGLGPSNVNGNIQAWVANNSLADPGHADFWRISPNGFFFSLRGYQEDSPREFRSLAEFPGEPSKSSGERLEVTLPVWRLAEFILRVDEMAQQMFEQDFSIQIECSWAGLCNRRLYAHNFAFDVPAFKSTTDNVKTTGVFTHQEVVDLLPEMVKKLTTPLYEAFEFYSPETLFYSQQISRLTGRDM